MVNDPAEVIAKRRLRRRLTFWRVAAIIGFAGVALTLASRYENGGFSDYIGRLEVSGIILNDTDRDEALRETVKQKALKALIVEIESPGGTFVGGEVLFKGLREVSKHKPVVAILGSMATSAAYMVALGSDRVYARNGTITGSIGVIMQTADIRELLGKIGIKPETIKSGPLKSQPNPVELFTPAARESTEEVINDLFYLFVDMVGQRRRMARDSVISVADGRVFSGRQALANGLIDEIGGIAEARRWLADNYQIGRDIPLKDLKVGDKAFSWRNFVDSMFRKTLFPERLRLDGALSVWQRYW